MASEAPAPSNSAEQLPLELIAQLREQLKATQDSTIQDYAAHWADDYCCTRYLRAHRLDVNKALTGLVNTIKWRIDFKVDDINAQDLMTEFNSKTFYLSHGRDKQGRPILVTIKPEGKETQQYDKEIKKIVYVLDKAVATMHHSLDKWIWLVDLRHFSYFNGTPFSVAKQALDIFVHHYPERLFKCYFIDAPLPFRALFKLLYVFLDPVTKQKVAFINDRTSKTFQETIHADIAPEQLESILGGSVMEYQPDNVEKPGRLEDIVKEVEAHHRHHKHQGDAASAAADADK